MMKAKWQIHSTAIPLQTPTSRHASVIHLMTPQLPATLARLINKSLLLLHLSRIRITIQFLFRQRFPLILDLCEMQTLSDAKLVQDTTMVPLYQQS